MYTLYGTRNSGACIIEIALQRCGVQWRQIDASPWGDPASMVALAQINPLKQIPTLQLPDGSVLTESAAILIHLGLRFPSSDLLPEDPAQVIRGLVYIAANCYSAISIIDYPQRWLDSDDEQLQALLANGTRKHLHRVWQMFADQFSGQLLSPKALPNALGIMAAAVSRWDGARAMLEQSRPQLAQALAQIDADPQVAPVFAWHWPNWPQESA